MCGIVGYASGDVSEEALRRMMDAIAHRGPDGEGLVVKDDVGLGHRRLAIIDLDGGVQPMVSRSGALWITFNGEIYNYRELKQELEKDAPFITDSDTEVILRLYERDGAQCVRRLRGMFAFAIYDMRTRTLFAARDHLGQKPFYYTDADGEFAFASEIKALLALKPSLRELNPQALHEYLNLRIITPPRSMFRRIHKLPPGHHLIYRDGVLRIEPYWSLDFRHKHRGGFRELLDALEDQLTQTVRYHLVSDVPVGAFLSGGLDSSLIVAMMSRFSQGFKTFSGDVPYGQYSELPWCRMVSERYGTQAHELEIAPSLVRTLPDLVWHLDEPSDPLSVCVYHIAELASREVKVVLGGDGGDELFGGYDRYFGQRYVSWYALLPEWFRRSVMTRALKLVPQGQWYRSVGHRLRWMHQLSFANSGARYARSLSYFYFSDAYRDRLYAPRLQDAAGHFNAEENLKYYFDAENAEQLIDRMLYTDCMTRLPDHPVMIQDRMTMAHGLEARAPFMDHELAAFCAAIPSRFKIRGRHLRYIQTQLARRHLPRALVERKKQGFASALPYLLRDEFRRLYGLLLHDSRLVAAGWLRAEGVDDLLRRHLHGGEDHGQRLWQLCNAEIRSEERRVGKECRSRLSPYH